ncbi:helix-turn-helix domain-containing protein [Cellulosimicrobium aquatile]|uniref:helix-turn-helix domain-containing protein n=1 Tax=Cellulosimicrobium aquatile TaxID=1612203 RepID=UPI001981A932|nr:helix-turn-helix transcriptional regulator [Cellulosimicrobium aquatile]
MAGKKIELGATGELVRENIQRLRRARGLGFAELSRELDRLGRPIPPLGLRRIEEGERRVDVDDLVALAVALWSSPTMLLSPPVFGSSNTAYTALGDVRTSKLNDWITGESIAPTAPESELVERAKFVAQTRPRRDFDGVSEEALQRTARAVIEAFRKQVEATRRLVEAGGHPGDKPGAVRDRTLVHLFDDREWTQVLTQAGISDSEREGLEQDHKWLQELHIAGPADDAS